MSGKTLTASELAPYIGRSRKTLYNMLKDGRFPVKAIPGTRPRLWNTADVDAWCAGRYPAGK